MNLAVVLKTTFGTYKIDDVDYELGLVGSQGPRTEPADSIMNQRLLTLDMADGDLLFGHGQHGFSSELVNKIQNILAVWFIDSKRSDHGSPRWKRSLKGLKIYKEGVQ